MRGNASLERFAQFLAGRPAASFRQGQEARLVFTNRKTP